MCEIYDCLIGISQGKVLARERDVVEEIFFFWGW